MKRTFFHCQCFKIQPDSVSHSKIVFFAPPLWKRADQEVSLEDVMLKGAKGLKKKKTTSTKLPLTAAAAAATVHMTAKIQFGYEVWSFAESFVSDFHTLWTTANISISFHFIFKYNNKQTWSSFKTVYPQDRQLKTVPVTFLEWKFHSSLFSSIVLSGHHGKQKYVWMSLWWPIISTCNPRVWITKVSSETAW